MKKNEIADYKKFAENIMNNFNYSNVINELKKFEYVILKSPFISEISDDILNELPKETLTAGFSRWIRDILPYNADFSQRVSRMNSPKGQAGVVVAVAYPTQ